MLRLIELLPLLAFFVTYFYLNGHAVSLGDFHYQFDGIYSATAVLMVATTLQVVATWGIKRELEKRSLGLLAVVLVCGAATLVFHNSMFIKWKPTLFNWAFGLILLGSHLFGKQNLVERLTQEQFHLPGQVTNRLLWTWTAYFFLVGALNLVVAYHFPEETWVKYKVWSFIPFTLSMSIITALMVAPHIKMDGTEPPEH